MTSGCKGFWFAVLTFVEGCLQWKSGRSGWTFNWPFQNDTLVQEVVGHRRRSDERDATVVSSVILSPETDRHNSSGVNDRVSKRKGLPLLSPIRHVTRLDVSDGTRKPFRDTSCRCSQFFIGPIIFIENIVVPSPGKVTRDGTFKYLWREKDYDIYIYIACSVTQNCLCTRWKNSRYLKLL